MLNTWPARSVSGWKTFLRNHTDRIAAIDLFVVPNISISSALWFHRFRGAGRRQVYGSEELPSDRGRILNQFKLADGSSFPAIWSLGRRQFEPRRGPSFFRPFSECLPRSLKR
jgi:hypothetical protein